MPGGGRGTWVRKRINKSFAISVSVSEFSQCQCNIFTISRVELDVGDVKDEKVLKSLRQVVSLLDQMIKNEVSSSVFYLCSSLANYRICHSMLEFAELSQQSSWFSV